MAGPSSKFPFPTFSGEGFLLWSRQMKKYLEHKGFWYLLDGKENAEPSVGPNDENVRAYNQDLLNDTIALVLIHKSLSPNISRTIFSALTAVEAWDLLHQKFERSNAPPTLQPARTLEPNVRCLRKRKRDDAPPAPEPVRTFEENVRCLRSRKRDDSPPAPLPVPEPLRTPKENVRCLRTRKRNDAPPTPQPSSNPEPNVRCLRKRKRDDAPPAPQPIRTPQENVRCLRSKKIAQSQDNSMKAILGSKSGKKYEVTFKGKKELKGVGKEWRRFVADHELKVGDQLTIDVTEHGNDGQEFTVSLRRCTSSAQLQSPHNASCNGMDDGDDDANDHDRKARCCTVIIHKDDIGDDVDVHSGDA